MWIYLFGALVDSGVSANDVDVVVVNEETTGAAFDVEGSDLLPFPGFVRVTLAFLQQRSTKLEKFIRNQKQNLNQNRCFKIVRIGCFS